MPPVASSSSSKTSATTAGSRRCVVLIDDEVSYLDLLEQLLGEQLACPIVSFNNPRKALKDMRHLNVGLIVTDYNMPGLTGLDLLAEARKFMPDVPAVMITAYAVEFTADQLANVPSLKAVVKKPFRWPVLAEHITKHWPSDSSPPFPGH
ncbi:MAG TPA: response regulator [Opitutaceae bacterium]|nr:response regulator [Opitutaceae bacterium]